MYKRKIFNSFFNRINEQRKFIQVLVGPRQIGKTTLVRQVIEHLDFQSHYASADAVGVNSDAWIEQQWEVTRTKASTENRKVLLVLDEIQKIPAWSEKVKKLWEEDTARKNNILVILLGSSQLLLQKGLTESLAGRFEISYLMHWPYEEMKDAFGFTLDEYIFFGGYPGSAGLIKEENRWRNYIIDSLVETAISKDILMMTRVDKPALLRRVFDLGCNYSGRILSYQKMLGQLQDAGNTITVAHYLRLLEQAGLIAGLEKFSMQKVRQKSSSPKLQVMDNALFSAHLGANFSEIRSVPEKWGRMVESCIGQKLINETKGKDIKVFYWSGRNREVDFVLSYGEKIIAIEVKSGARRTSLQGLEVFSKEFKVYKTLLVGKEGIPLEDFLLMPLEKLFE
ncbi:MAG: AAA family ATPase [Elusimicrobia bacterium]|nr:AAA family ATPase [Elusimicrobiota bacterium]